MNNHSNNHLYLHNALSRGPQTDKYILKHEINTLYGLSKTSVMSLKP